MLTGKTCIWSEPLIASVSFDLVILLCHRNRVQHPLVRVVDRLPLSFRCVALSPQWQHLLHVLLNKFSNEGAALNPRLRF